MYNTLLIKSRQSSIIIIILNNKAIISQNVFILKYACGSIINQDK